MLIIKYSGMATVSFTTWPSPHDLRGKHPRRNTPIFCVRRDHLPPLLHVLLDFAINQKRAMLYPLGAFKPIGILYDYSRLGDSIPLVAQLSNSPIRPLGVIRTKSL